MQRIYLLIAILAWLWWTTIAVASNVVVITGSLSTQSSFQAVLTGILQTQTPSNNDLVILVPCAPLAVTNGNVDLKTCNISCDTGYQLKDKTCHKQNVWWWGGWGGGGWWGWGGWGGASTFPTTLKSEVKTGAVVSSGVLTPQESWSLPQAPIATPSLQQMIQDFTQTHAVDSLKGTQFAQAYASVQNSFLPQELKDAYTYAYLRGITTQPSIEKAELMRGLTRAEMAKMMSVYAMTVLGKKVQKSDFPQYVDTQKIEGDLAEYIVKAYQLGIMGVDAQGNALESFNPYAEVTRAEFATVLSRVLYGNIYNQEGVNFAEKHLEALKAAGILKDTTPHMKEVRGWVMLMLQRAEGVK